MNSPNPQTGLAVYIHWPYCARICPYCDFNVYKQKTDAFLTSAIIRDLSFWANWSGRRELSSIHFGGGTPSLMPPEDIAALINHAATLWSPRKDMEVAIEANPGDANRKTFQALRDAGVNRLSLGVQTFNDAALSMLGRDHNGAQGKAALDLSLGIFPSVSLDLIFGWAGQTTAQWDYDLNIALQSGAPHISAYQLTIEPGTAFAKAEDRGAARAVDEDQSASFYEQTEAALTSAGYEHYEVSNYAKPGFRSQHNLAYWRGQDYVGAGPGAHGRLTVYGTRFATVAALRPGDYQRRIAEYGHGLTEKEPLSPENRAEEYVLMGLRTDEGLLPAYFEQLSGQSLPTEPISAYIDGGFLEFNGPRLRATKSGRLVLNHITETLLMEI